MAFTDNSDLYGAVNEAGINLVVKHLKRQRPSLFNYGTEFIAKTPKLHCHSIDADPMVLLRNNPLMSIESPLPILGTNNLLSLHYCIQFVNAQIDFHKSNAITLPSELGELPEQHFAITAKVCAGLGCPDDRLTDYIEAFMDSFYEAISLDDIVAGKSTANIAGLKTHRKRPDPITIPVDRLECFCLEVFAVCHIETRKVGNQHIFSPKLDNIEIVNLAPEGLENSIECYAEQVIRLGLLPRIRIALEKLVFDQLQIVNVAIKPADSVATNPAIEDDELKVFIDMEVS